MGLAADDDLLQDFLVEASEILEQLGEQLVDLEQRPEDADLLNAIFRGFHTVKGGAGFLSITSLVEACHCAEDVFNVLRQGQRGVTPDLMDAILQTLDLINDMMAEVREGRELLPADRGLIARLEALALPEGESDWQTPPSEPTSADPGTSADEPAAQRAGNQAGRAQDVFEEMLEQAAAEMQAESDTVAAGEEITEAEFEALLDELHGKGRHGGVPKPESLGEQAPDPGGTKAASDEITEEEFEALLDRLHGKGRHGGVPPTAVPASPEPPTPKPGAAKVVAPGLREASAVDKPGTAAPAKSPAAETTVRVDTQRLDDIMNMVGELVLVRNRLATLKSASADEQLANAVANLDLVTADLQLAVMKTRMQPVKKVFGRFPRVVRDLARNLKKEVELEMHGEDTDLDKNLVEALADPMVHLVRNAVDHGIEPPDEREAAGKPRRGLVVLSAAQEGDHIVLSIVDDGKGMDAEVLRRKAVEKGLMDEEAAARLDDKDCYNLIFHPGFSTKSEISDVSGRGVGMDVVKTKIGQMNGTVEIESEKGKGSRILIKLPLTLAILPTLMIVLGRQPFALPLANVVEIFNLDLERTHTVDGQLTMRVRSRALPLFYLRRWLVHGEIGDPDYTQGGGHVVVVNVGSLQVGLVVDHLVGQEEVVIKPLGAMLQGIDGMAGATITGDGKIALILDIPGLMRKYAHSY